MKAPQVAAVADWQVDVKLWVNRAGEAILGPGRLELLEGIDRHHSISAAARAMGMSYRHAWLMVQRANDAAGASLVTAATGGTNGGGAQLTPLGRWAVALLRDTQQQLRQAAAGLWRKSAQTTATEYLHLAAAVSLEEVLGLLLTDYAAEQPAVRVRAVYGASDELAEHVLAGAPADLFVSADPTPLQRLEAVGLADRKARTVLGGNTLAAISRADGDVAVRSCAGLARAGGQRIALAGTTCPLGRYTAAYLKQEGVYDALRQRAVEVENSRAVSAAVRAGRADVGLVYGSEATQAVGCRLLFKVKTPADAIQCTGTVIHQGQQAEAARSLLAFLASPAARRRFRECGFQPLN